MTSIVPGETLRVLAVSTSEETHATLRELLDLRAGEHRLYWVSQADLAAARAAEVLPHVVLVDNELGIASSATLIGQLVGKLPRTAVLALVDADDMKAARQATLAGARGFVTKPLDGDELMATLRQMLAQRGATVAPDLTPHAAGRIVVFCSPKGGTGRTLMATNTAIELHRMTEQGVALIDADFAAPALDVALNLDPSRNIIDLLPRMARLDADMIFSVLAEHASGIRVLLAPPPADLTHPISLPQVQQVLVWMKRMFPWVIVDLGLPMDETAFAFLDGSDRIIMSVLPEMVGLRNTRLMIDQLLERGYPREKIWLALNRSTIHGGVPLRDIEERLRVQVNYQIPDDQALATHSINRGVPLTISHPRSAVARGIKVMAAALAAEGKMAEPAGMAEVSGNGKVGGFKLLTRRA